MTNLNPINERNIERLIDEALAQRDGLLAKLRTATNLDMRRTLAAELTIAGEYLNFLLSGEATKTEHDFDAPLSPEMRKALEQEVK